MAHLSSNELIGLETNDLVRGVFSGSPYNLFSFSVEYVSRLMRKKFSVTFRSTAPTASLKILKNKSERA